MSIPILKAENLVKRFGVWKQIVSVDGFTAQINSGEIVALLGGNGAGKSTTFDMISGLTKPTSGTISLYQPETDSWRVITNDPLYKRAQHGICYLPQKPSVFESLTTRQNLLGIMEIMKDSDLRKSMNAYDSSLTNRGDFCDALLHRFDLYKRRDEKVCRLSGGEKRRLEIARSFIRKPKLILLDEPYAAVDLPGIELCGKMFRRVREMGVSLLIVDHRIDEVLKLSDRVIFLHEGKIYAIGTAYQIVRIPLVQEKLLRADTARLLDMFSSPGRFVEHSSRASETIPEIFKSKSVRMD
ncbi:MAG: ATP-binding cassette domain-containing protein [Thermoguttaceae bacterium]|nr:ATP-binding cassette domain-containing protein [Thermoguttaceae bacterium]